MNRLIILEGNDGIGKTTQARILAEHFGTQTLSQPNDKGILGFLRDVCKGRSDLLPFERQLLFAISQTADAYEYLRGGFNNLVMDRSYLSGLVYGSLAGLSASQYNLLFEILNSVHVGLLSKIMVNEVYIITLYGKNRLDQPDDDAFEGKLKWDDINKAYINLENYFTRLGKEAFSVRETWYTVDVTGRSIEDVSGELIGFIKEDGN